MPLQLPNLTMSGASAASRAELSNGFSADGFVVNYGGGASSSAAASAMPAVPWYVWAAASVALVLWVKRRKS
jgi:hypothetical protein